MKLEHVVTIPSFKHASSLRFRRYAIILTCIYLHLTQVSFLLIINLIISSLRFFFTNLLFVNKIAEITLLVFYFLF